MTKKINRYQTLDEFVEEHFLENPDDIPVYLETVLEEYDKDPDIGTLLMALRQIAKAQGGMTELSKKTNLSRESLYKTLSPKGNPRLKNLQSILNVFGYSVTFKPINNTHA